MVRGIYNSLVQNNGINNFKIEVTNEESIHQHNAYAMMDSSFVQ